MSRLIVIEESRTVQRMIEIALQGLSLDITTHKSPQALSASTKVDLLVCDAVGAWGDEAALVSQLTARGITAPIIMLTPQNRAPEGFLGGQIVSALAKPFHTQTLTRAVCQVLGREAPYEELFASLPKVPLKRGGHSGLSEPVVPASLQSSVDVASARFTDPKGLIPPPEAPLQAQNFQTIIGVPIPSNLPADEAEEAGNPFEASTSFGFVPEPQGAPNAPLPTLMGGSYQALSDDELAEPNAFEASTSFGFSPDSLAQLQMGAPPPVYDEPPPAFEAPEEPEEELDELDDSFSALDHAELDDSPEWEDETSADISSYTNSTSPLLNRTVTEVLQSMVTSLREAGLQHATGDEALQLLSQVAWEVIPELAERVVREEIERALEEGTS